MKSKIKHKFTYGRLAAFANRFGEAHLDLASHAAFPLALTPELLYCLRENFVPDVPFIAVADILLFLCQPVGYQLYELEGEVRNELFVYLKKRLRNQKLYKQRLHNLSDFMVAYIRQQLKTNDYADEDLGATPHWTALAYISPKQAVNDIAKALKEALDEKLETLVQFSSLMESYADTEPLINSGFQPLLTLSRGLDAKARGDEEVAEAEFEKLRQEYGNQLEVAGVKFDIPIIVDGLSNFEFQVVTVNRRGKIIKRETKQARYFIEDLGENINLEMVAIPGGKFMMGSPDGEGYEDEHLNQEKKEYILSKQLVRSGTSIGANIAEANGAISQADFYAKISIAYKECLETKYWLSLLKDTGYIEQKAFNSIYEDADEIGKILFSILKTTKINQQIKTDN